MHRQLLQELNARKVMNAETSTRIKDTLLAYRSDEIDGLKTRHDLISLAEKSTGQERNVVLAVESLIPAMADVDLRTISENHLAASYIHPVMQSLFSIACNNKVSHCSNTLPEVDDTTGKRPDYIVDVYERYQYAYSSCFGEIKIEKANETLKVLDFYRLAIFGRNAIESHNLNGIICFQTIGSLVTFYYMLPRADFFIFLEVTSIKIPLVKRDIVSIITHLDDMLSLVCLHELVENTNELASSYPPILPYVYVQNERKSLPKKRKPSLTSISSSSKH
ncbi:hypothetical protein G6F57_002552 [Rhizopus arrhizus]|uniref:Uncharacterized protein n=1 Tax=Rhizopus oryzae TaxID=64495 RepID=A0A9P6WXU7_RHIOR|nr:hypothetical protein G6F24_010773 [Rhizopus arrhizus]KAG0784627.1 hypothetical protein G6F21_009783 [Rhizopus arrhizus]KAG0805847.1 hypothetical protein G6F20_011585 [Rhizopus arrhizus]KAG0821328.1 hypothetical protein G6F18_012234 [Rhizopus arrhizus]KAG0822008.1 hypothetical protein G6F19_011614 [Rhizopus arrhizus]